MSAAIRRVGFVGIGNMGWPMAANLLKAGFDAAVGDDVPGRSGRCASEVGGQAAADAAAAAKGADAVVTILPTSKQVAAVAAQIAPMLRPA
jgi:3-hydroxyisobutyrate dehydrogenase